MELGTAIFRSALDLPKRLRNARRRAQYWARLDAQERAEKHGKDAAEEYRKAIAEQHLVADLLRVIGRRVKIIEYGDYGDCPSSSDQAEFLP